MIQIEYINQKFSQKFNEYLSRVSRAKLRLQFVLLITLVLVSLSIGAAFAYLHRDEIAGYALMQYPHIALYISILLVVSSFLSIFTIAFAYLIKKEYKKELEKKILDITPNSSLMSSEYITNVFNDVDIVLNQINHRENLYKRITGMLEKISYFLALIAIILTMLFLINHVHNIKGILDIIPSI